VIIIGAGISGLSTAALLTNENISVQVFEKNSKVGGRTACSLFRNHILDNGFHIMPFYKTSAVYQILEKEIKNNKDITICSDSIYAIRCCTTYGKKNADKKWSTEIPNKELVKTIYNLYKSYKNIHFLHVRAHTGNNDPHSIGNFHADRLANLAISKI